MNDVDILALGFILLVCGAALAVLGAFMYEAKEHKRAAYVAWGTSAFFLVTVLSRVWWNFVTN